MKQRRDTQDFLKMKVLIRGKACFLIIIQVSRPNLKIVTSTPEIYFKSPLSMLHYYFHVRIQLLGTLFNFLEFSE